MRVEIPLLLISGLMTFRYDYFPSYMVEWSRHAIGCSSYDKLGCRLIGRSSSRYSCPIIRDSALSNATLARYRAIFCSVARYRAIFCSVARYRAIFCSVARYRAIEKTLFLDAKTLFFGRKKAKTGIGAHETRSSENRFFARIPSEMSLIVDGLRAKLGVFDSSVAFATKCSAGVAFATQKTLEGLNVRKSAPVCIVL
jgi:hypothetical protein